MGPAGGAVIVSAGEEEGRPVRAVACTLLVLFGALFPAAPAGRGGTAAAGEAHRGPGPVFRDCDFCPEMVVVPAGRFRMGCVSGATCFDDELPVREVRLRSFALSKHEVVFAEYDRFAEARSRDRPNDEGWGRGDRPAINVSWEDATAYADWLSAQTGEGYRLPSEAEWEYAARAGTTMRYAWGPFIGRNQANCEGCGSRWDGVRTAPAGSFAANAWGLHDIHCCPINSTRTSLPIAMNGPVDSRCRFPATPEATGARTG